MKIEELVDFESGESNNNHDHGNHQIVRGDAKMVLVGAGARILFYPTLMYNVFRNKVQAEFRWWDEVDQFLLLGAVPFPNDVPKLKQLGVGGVITLNEPYETLVPSSLYHAHGINHLVIPTRDYLFAPSFSDISQAVDFIHKNASCGRTTYVHCKAGRGRSTTIVLCYLVKHKHMTPDFALEFVRSRRPRVLLAPSQWKAVQEYNKHLPTPTKRSSSVNNDQEHNEHQISTLSCSQSMDAAMITNEDLEEYRKHLPSSTTCSSSVDIIQDHNPTQLSTLVCSSSMDAVMITTADLEGYLGPCDNHHHVTTSCKMLPMASRAVSTRPIMARLSCLFASLKVSSNCGSANRTLAEARAC